MLKMLLKAHKVIGIKQATRAIQSREAAAVFLAQDAESRLTEPIRALSQAQNLPVYDVDSMRELGQACGIQVGAAAAVILRQELSE